MSSASGTARSVVVPVSGQRSRSIGAYQDAEGNWLTGDTTCRIHLPEDVPANMLWPLTVVSGSDRL